MQTNDDPPFSYRVKVGHVAGNPLHVAISAEGDELKALAAHWGVDAVDSFSADLELGQWKRDGIRVAGRVRARIRQSCVVTLEPVEQVVDEPIAAIYVPEGSKLSRRKAASDGEIVIDAEGPDMPETFTGDTLDVGAVAVEFVAMAIDPYPRKSGVGPGDHIESEGDEDGEGTSPFAALNALKGRAH